MQQDIKSYRFTSLPILLPIFLRSQTQIYEEQGDLRNTYPSYSCKEFYF